MQKQSTVFGAHLSDMCSDGLCTNLGQRAFDPDFSARFCGIEPFELMQQTTTTEETSHAYWAALEELSSKGLSDSACAGLILKELAHVYESAGDKAQAQSLFHRSLIILDQNLGHNHTEVKSLASTILVNYG